MKTACTCSANKTGHQTQKQAVSLIEAALMTAMEKRCETPIACSQAHFVPAVRTDAADSWPMPADSRAVTASGEHTKASRAVLHARGVSLPGPERMNGSACTRRRIPRFSAAD